LLEAGVEQVEYRPNGLTGRAWPKEKRLRSTEPTTRRRLYIFAHECGHVALEHDDRKPHHRREYEAERYAHAALRRHGVAVPKRSTEEGKRYVARKIHQAVRRGAKSIDKDALHYCKGYLSQQVKAWLAARESG
jgi:hypothetical protein